MPKISYEEFGSRLDTIGAMIQTYLEKIQRSRKWFAVNEMGITSTALNYKMKDNEKFRKSELSVLKQLKIIE